MAALEVGALLDANIGLGAQQPVCSDQVGQTGIECTEQLIPEHGTNKDLHVVTKLRSAVKVKAWAIEM